MLRTELIPQGSCLSRCSIVSPRRLNGKGANAGWRLVEEVNGLSCKHQAGDNDVLF